MSTKGVSLAVLVLRLGLGAAMVYAGAGKLFGIWGGHGYQATLGWLESNLGVPMYLGWLAIIAEFFGGLGIIFGVLTRLASFGVACTMGTAVYMHIVVMGGEKATISGFGYPAALFVMALALIFTGAGKVSIEGLLFWREDNS